MSKVSFSFCSALCLACAVAPAWGQVFRCVDANEHVTYTNIASEGKNCKRMEVETAPTPAPGKSGTIATPVNFPKVSPDAQRERDKQRRAILSQELAREEQGLAAAKQTLAEQEQIRTGNERNYQKVLERLQPYKEEVERRERNIEAINRELAALR